MSDLEDFFKLDDQGKPQYISMPIYNDNYFLPPIRSNNNLKENNFLERGSLCENFLSLKSTFPDSFLSDFIERGEINNINDNETFTDLFGKNNDIQNIGNVLQNDSVNQTSKNENKIENKFTIKKLGRKKKDENNSTCKHTNKSNDNGSNKFINKCIESLDNCINLEINPDYIPNNKNNDIQLKLNKPTLKKHIPQKVDEKANFFKNEIKTYYEKYIDLKNCKNRNSYKIHNKILIEKLEASNDVYKKVNTMLKISFKDYLEAFLKDEKIISDNIVLNKNFKTLKDCFNNIQDKGGYYSQEKKNEIKNYTLNLINGKIKARNRKGKDSEI